VTFLDVLDDAVKIGLGGFLGWLITRSTRSHEFEKERRRRKQDCLERAVEDLGELESALDSWCSYCIGTRRLRDAKNSSAAQRSLENALAKNEQVDAAVAKLIRSHGKLIVFGFGECAALLQAYHDELVDLRVIVSNVVEGVKEEKDYYPSRQGMAKIAQDFRKTVTKAFATL
jgi:hypothetical protein